MRSDFGFTPPHTHTYTLYKTIIALYDDSEVLLDSDQENQNVKKIKTCEI